MQGGRVLLSVTPGYFPSALLYSTDLNSSREPVDIGGDPSFSLNLGPAAILRVNSVVTPLFYRLSARKNKSKMSQRCHFVHC